METCFKILQLKFDQKLTNRCIALTLNISASTIFEVLTCFRTIVLPWPLPEAIPMTPWKNASSRLKAHQHQSLSCRTCSTSILR
ncbi:putative transposase [Candidatus Erwinia dacicola]|uniref:Transposase n=1 Tax=Candidatus Erwinia dacicola TaxID=252393 RepID=A0A328TPR1_9GAMM|nr:putative transposase [Candidatus Erwinia dacicola]